MKNMNAKKMACPICKSSEFQLLKSNDRYLMGINTCGCKRCGLLQTNPRPDEQSLAKFYREDYRKYYQGVIEPTAEYIKENKKDIRMDLAAKYLKRYLDDYSINGVLDVGCSEGAFFAALLRAGFSGKIFGVEPNREFGAFAERHYGAEVRGKLENIDAKVGLVTLTHVFEHLLQPDEFLQNIKDRLTENGLIYIDVPDVEEYHSVNDLHIAHLFHYNQNSLSLLLRLNGFEVLTIEKHLPPGHPKSIRVIARVEQAAPLKVTEAELKESYQSNQVAWRRVRHIPVMPLILRRVLARMPGLRSSYQMLKRFAG